MTQPEPPLARVTQRVADTAKKMVDDSAAVVFAESKIIDKDKYEMKDAIDTVTKLVGIGITGASDIGRIASRRNRQTPSSRWVSTSRR